MKNLLKIFILIAMSCFSISAFAGSPQKYFESLASDPEFDYTYISPLMLQAMGDTPLSHENYGGLPVSSQNLKCIETISTYTGGTNESLWKIIKRIKNDNKLETLTTKKKDYYRYDVFARLSGDKKYVTHLLVITQNGGENVSVVYMEGKIPLGSINYSLNV